MQLNKYILTFLVIVFSTFQITQYLEEIDEISEDCFNKNEVSPMKMLSGKPGDCTDSILENLLTLKKENNVTFGIYNGKERISETWFSNDFIELKNRYVSWLSIINPNIEIIKKYHNNDEFILIFGGNFGSENQKKYSIWAWKISKTNPKEKPKEINLVDLLAGSDSNRDFATYLKDTSNYENSFIPNLLESWKRNGYVDNYLSVKAILPQECGQVLRGDKDNPPKPDEVENYFLPIENDQPICINEALTTNEPVRMLVKVGTTYNVWSTKNAKPKNADFFNNPEIKDNKWLAWWAIVAVEGCSIYPIGNSMVLQVCDETINCINASDTDKENPISIYNPLKLLNTEHQKKLCKALKVPKNYNDSPIKTLIENWADGKTKKFKIISYFNEIVINGKDSLVNQLNVDLDEDFKKHFYLIQTKKGNGKHQYYVCKNNDSKPLSTWYTDEIHAYKNPWLGKLALADRNIKVLNIENDVITFKTNSNGDKPHLWSWKIKGKLKPKEYAPLKDLIAAKNDMGLVYSFVKSINVIDDALKNNIINHFKGNFNKILEFYPKKDNLSNTNYKPLNNLKVTDKIVDSSFTYKYLIQKNNKYYNSASLNEEITWYNDLAAYNNKWFARLALTEPSIKIVSFNEANICFVSPNSTGNLWSISTTNTISEKLLIKNSDTFFLTKTKMESYVNGLPGNASESEKSIFINSITNDAEFEYGDFFFKNERVLFLIKKSTNILHRISDTKTDGIKLNLVNNEDKQVISIFNWNQIATIYKKPWVRKEFEKNVVYNSAESFELWFGKNRLGINKSGRIGLFLSNEFRDFGYVSFQKIKSKNDNTIFKKTNLTLNDFMGTCVRDDWSQTKMWRANPLGLFDRITN